MSQETGSSIFQSVVKTYYLLWTTGLLGLDRPTHKGESVYVCVCGSVESITRRSWVQHPRRHKSTIHRAPLV